MDIRKYLKNCNLNCNNCDKFSNTCKQVNYLYSKEKALNYKHNIYSNRRNYDDVKSVEYDLIFELFIADNMDLKPQVILSKYNYVEDYEYDSCMKQKVNRIKRKITNLYTNTNKSFSECLLDNTDMKSFTIDELNIYVEAVKYLYNSKSFKMSYVKHPHKYQTFNGNWFMLRDYLNNNSDIYRGNELYFLGSFCKCNKKKRDLCNRLFIDLGEKECFSKADIDYVLKELCSLSYNENMFFKHIEFIRTFNK